MFKRALKGLGWKVRNAFNPQSAKSQSFAMFMRDLNVSHSFHKSDYETFAREGFMANPYVMSAITQTAQSCASVPPALYRVSGSGEVARAVNQYDRKAHADRIERRKRRSAVRNIRDRAARKESNRSGIPVAVAKGLATKALVQTGELEPIDAHELLDLLLYPNDWYQRSYQQFIQAWVYHLEIGGESFMEPIKTDGGVPRELYVVPPKDVKVEKGSNEHPIRGFRLQHRGGDLLLYDPDPTETEVFYSRYYNPINPLRGLSPARAAAWSIDINNEGRKWNLSLLQNGAALSGIVSAKGALSPQQVANLKEKFNEKYAGSDNAGKIMALDEVEGVGFTPMSQTVKDMQWAQLSNMSALECAITWNVPPEILGHDESKTFANYEEARRAFYLEKIIPLMDFIYGDLNTTVVPLFGDDLWLDYDTQAIDALADDINELHKRVREDVEASLIMINEGRERIGLEEADGGDVILTDVRKIPLATAVQDGVDPPPEDDEGEEEQGMTIRERAFEALQSSNGSFIPD